MASPRDQIKDLIAEINDSAEKGASVGAAEKIQTNTRKMWDLFKEMKKPEVQVQRVEVKDEAEIQRLKEEVNKLSNQIANLQCQATERAKYTTIAADTLERVFQKDVPDPVAIPPMLELAPDKWTKAHVLGLICNPFYTFDSMVSPALAGREGWIDVATRYIKHQGLNWFFSNMLGVMRLMIKKIAADLLTSVNNMERIYHSVKEIANSDPENPMAKRLKAAIENCAPFFDRVDSLRTRLMPKEMAVDNASRKLLNHFDERMPSDPQLCADVSNVLLAWDGREAKLTAEDIEAGHKVVRCRDDVTIIKGMRNLNTQ